MLLSTYRVTVGEPGTVEEFRIEQPRARVLPAEHCSWFIWTHPIVADETKTMLTLCPADRLFVLKYQFGTIVEGKVGPVLK
jgi:hypothetical protein